MSDLQCPATLLLTPPLDTERAREPAPEREPDPPGAASAQIPLSEQGRDQERRLRTVIARRHVTTVCAVDLPAALPTARVLAAVTGAGSQELPAPAGDAAAVRAALQAVADLHRGETVLVVLTAPVIATLVAPHHDPVPGRLTEVAVDGDGWVLQEG